MEFYDSGNIVSQFATQGTITDIRPLGKGLINDSYHVYTLEKGMPEYVLQRINNSIFTNVELLMHNIISVTSYIKEKYQRMNIQDIDRRVLSFVPLKNDPTKYFIQDDNGNYWRLMIYIQNSKSISEVNPETSYNVGLSFGQFESILADIPTRLEETIPNFHNMEFRLQQLQEAVENDRAHRYADVKDIVDDILRDQEDMCKGEKLYREGKLPKRICHCDTKVDNLLFDNDTNDVLCVIDLDTVMPNFVFSDIGDFLRSAANTSKEDEEDLDKVNFDLTIFHSFIRGYLESAKAFLLPIEIENIPYATQLFPYMQAVRFLTDYLNGDTYYKIQYPEHNLIRTKAQFKLYQSVKEHAVHMDAFIKECLSNR